MIKYLFVTINSIALFFYSLLFDGGVSVTGNIPTSINPGTEAAAEIVVKKGSLGGFAKLQVEVPEGFTIKESDSKGATFSFSGGIAKWIWTGIPSDAEFAVKFILQVNASVAGAKTIAAKYSYVENNNKQVVEMVPAEVKVGDVVAANSTSTQSASPSSTQTAVSTPTSSTTAAETKTETAVTSTATNAATENTLVPMNSSQEPNSNVTASRTISKAGDNEWNVNVKIKKDGIKGFARYSDNLPEGFSAKQGKTDGSSFSVADNKIKFVWVNVPTSEFMEVSYVLSGVPKPDTQLEGEFSYLENNQSKAIKVPAEKIAGASDAVSSNSTSTTNTTTSLAVTETKTSAAVTNTSTSEPVTTTTTEAKKDQTTENKNTSSAPTETPVVNSNPAERKTSSVAYCVQIGAYTNAKVTDEKISRRHGLSEKIYTEMADGFTKFMVGRFDEYKLARDHRETIKGKGVNGAFVAAYNGPKRITVQEALMVSNQKWYR